MSPQHLVLMGETASGKSALAVMLALRYDAEIISADSRQIYRGMEIGTAAPTPAQLAAARHHLVSFLEPAERYSAARFVADAGRLAHEISARGRRVIVVGGTGFYVRTLCGDMQLASGTNDGIRKRIAREFQLHDVTWLHEWLSIRDPVRAAQIHASDRYRLGRALEVALTPPQALGAPVIATDTSPDKQIVAPRSDWYKLWVRQPAAVLEERIALRTRSMLEQGFIEEAERIGPHAVASSAVGYLHALAYIRGQATHAELTQHLQRATRQYAKRQRTWLRSEPRLTIIDRADDFAAVTAWVEKTLGWTPRP